MEYKLEVTKKVCNTLYDEANRNPSNKQVRYRYAAKGKKKQKISVNRTIMHIKILYQFDE